MRKKFSVKLLCATAALALAALLPGTALAEAPAQQPEVQVEVEADVEETNAVTLSQSTVTLYQTGANPNPGYGIYIEKADKSYSYVTWSSSNTSVARVDGGYITGIAPGTATITVRTSAGESATCRVTVEKQKMELNKKEMTLTRTYKNPNPAESLTIAKVYSEMYFSVRWTSSNPAVAVVDEVGRVTAVSEGKAIITATTSRGESASCEVIVNSTIGHVSMNKSMIDFTAVGQRDALTAVVSAGPNEQEIVWTSSNPAVVQVGEDGSLKAVGEGRATITARSTVYGFSASCECYVGQNAIKERKDAERREMLEIALIFGGMLATAGIITLIAVSMSGS